MKKILTAAVCITAAVSLSGCSLMTVFLETKMNAPKSEQPQITGTEAAMEYECEPADGMMYLGDVNACAMPVPYEEPVPDWNTEEYKYIDENGWVSTAATPFSTFAADVDTASYANLRRMLLEGREVPADAVRIEEMINYFSYDYPEPEGDEPFSVTTQIAPCPWNEDTDLMLIGLKAKEVPAGERTASNLVFLIDVSGSMDEQNKLPLVKRAFRLLVEELNEEDTISIVTYASEDRIVLDGMPGDEKTQICDAIEDLQPGGGTDGSRGIITAYEIAMNHFIEGGNNRVILATDGDLNIGMTDEGSLTRLITEKAESGVFLSVLGFGEGNISDTNMEALADHGNGNYSYIDSISEARKVLIDEAGGTLFTVAKDVKLQAEFNPARVKGYRLIGYENRTMSAESFADDRKDGGEIGSGHTVTALYEIASVDSPFEISTVESKYDTAGKAEEGSDNPYADEWGTVHIRYKEPDAETSRQLDAVVNNDCVRDEMDDILSWAAGVAQAGMLLRGSEYAGTSDLASVRARLKPLAEGDDFREEFIYLMSRMDVEDHD